VRSLFRLLGTAFISCALRSSAFAGLDSQPYLCFGSKHAPPSYHVQSKKCAPTLLPNADAERRRSLGGVTSQIDGALRLSTLRASKEVASDLRAGHMCQRCLAWKCSIPTTADCDPVFAVNSTWSREPHRYLISPHSRRRRPSRDGNRGLQSANVRRTRMTAG